MLTTSEYKILNNASARMISFYYLLLGLFIQFVNMNCNFIIISLVSLASLISSQYISNWFGGSGGVCSPTLEANQTNATINKICTRSDDLLHGIQVYFNDNTSSPWAGGSSGEYECFSVNNGECFNYASIATDWSLVRGIQFGTSDSETTPFWGDEQYSARIGEKFTEYGYDYCLTKIDVCSSGDNINRIRFYAILPPMATLSEPSFWTDWYGGSGGSCYDIFESNSWDRYYISNIAANYGNDINGIKVGFADSSGSGWAGNDCCCCLTRGFVFVNSPPYECFSGVNLNAGSYIDGIQFIKSSADLSSYNSVTGIFEMYNYYTLEWWGGTGGTRHEIQYGDGYCLTKIQVCAGSIVDRIRFYFVNTNTPRPTPAPSPPTISPTGNPSVAPTPATKPPTPAPTQPTTSPTTFAPTLITMSPTQAPTNAITSCLNNGEYKISAWYTASDIDNNIIPDISGNDNDAMIIDSTGLNIMINDSIALDDNTYIIGTSQTSISFPVILHPTQHTIIYVARYFEGGSRQRILQMSGENGLIGFWGGSAGVGYENGWITDVIDRFGNQWVISSQQPSLYRGNFMNYTVSSSPGLSTSTTNILGINTGWSSEYSDYGFAELLVFNQLLDIQSIECIEQYLDDKYGLNYAPTGNPSFEPTGIPSIEPTVTEISMLSTKKPTVMKSNGIGSELTYNVTILLSLAFVLCCT